MKNLSSNICNIRQYVDIQVQVEVLTDEERTTLVLDPRYLQEKFWRFLHGTGRLCIIARKGNKTTAMI
jgi:hypothetical protein